MEKNNQMVIDDTVVSVNCKLYDAQNEPVTEEVVFDYLHGGYGDILEKLEEALSGKSLGHKAVIHLEPDDAFGQYDPQLLRVAARDQFEADVAEGMCFVEESEDDQEEHLYSITDVTDEAVIMDANHPLAGMALRFELTIIAIRDATALELQQGSAFLLDANDEDTADLRNLKKNWMTIDLNPNLKRTIH